jgi:hypothetical protein
MATNFPGGIDTFTAASPTSGLDNPSHSGLHNDLGDAVTATQTAMGLVHLKTESFSAVASQSINDVFSTDYDQYKILTQISNSSAQSLRFRLRVSGGDLTGSVYTTQSLFASGATVTSSRAATTTSLDLGTVRSVGRVTFEILIGNPFLTQVTTAKSQADNLLADSITTPGVDFYFSTVNNTISYTGFTLFPASGNMTGSVTVLGVRK